MAWSSGSIPLRGVISSARPLAADEFLIQSALLNAIPSHSDIFRSPVAWIDQTLQRCNANGFGCVQQVSHALEPSLIKSDLSAV
jgi:hypothetical protein